MIKRLLNCSPKEMLALKPAELKDAIRMSEGRAVSALARTRGNNYIQYVTNAEVCAGFGADIVIMGKSLAGHDEGHNLIEPALQDKPIVTGHVLRNFRFILNVLLQENAVATVTHDSELEEQLRKLLVNKELREELGKRAGRTIRKHAGATERTVNELESLLKK